MLLESDVFLVNFMEKLKWGLIGAGDIVRKRVAPALKNSETGELFAVSRHRAELAKSFAEEFGAKKHYADWREMLADKEIDAVYVATPVYLHKEQTLAAARAGIHVLCEKPMALNAAECNEMIAECQANKVKLGIAYYRHFYPVINRIKEIIAAGEIGKVAVAQMNAFEYLEMSPDDPRHWFLEKEKSGGGPMMDFGCHRLEVLNNLFGAVNSVKSIISSDIFKREVEDTALTILYYQSGVCANLTVTHAAVESQDTLEIFGTKGSIRVPVLNKGTIHIAASGSERTEVHPPHKNIHQPLIEDFAESILKNRNPQVTGETGKIIAALEDEIYKNSF